MAARTRSSLTPRARNCEFTICCRRLEYRAGLVVKVMQRFAKGDSSILFLPPADAHIKAHNPVLITRPLHRQVAVDVVLTLDDLLRALRNVGAIGEGKVVGKFLFDCDLRSTGGGVRLRGEPLRIDLDSTDPEQP